MKTLKDSRSGICRPKKNTLAQKTYFKNSQNPQNGNFEKKSHSASPPKEPVYYTGSFGEDADCDFRTKPNSYTTNDKFLGSANIRTKNESGVPSAIMTILNKIPV